MARQLGREGFGAFMFALGLTTALLVGAGFGTDELISREVARDHSRAGRYLSDVAALKTASAVVLLGLAVVIVNLGDFTHDARMAVVILGLGVAIEAIAAHLVHDLPGLRAARPGLAVDRDPADADRASSASWC